MPKRRKSGGERALPESADGWRVLRRKRLVVRASFGVALSELPPARLTMLRAALGAARFNAMSARERTGQWLAVDRPSADGLVRKLESAGCSAQLVEEDEYQVVAPSYDLLLETREDVQRYVRRLITLGAVVENVE